MIVTTHSMEEAEALASKVGIMVEGKFKCFGTVQHLKDKFGKGFEIEFKIDLENVSEKFLTKSKIKNKDTVISDFGGQNKTTDIQKVMGYLQEWSEIMESGNLVDEFNDTGALKDYYQKVK